MSIDEALAFGVEELRGVALRARYECELILSHILECDRTFLHTHGELEVDERRFLELLQRRKSHEPLEYMLQKVSFYSHTFYIEKGALIPRPETELVVDMALKIIDRYSMKRVCEVGIGSGIISCILALSRDIELLSGDISSDALKIASVNIKNFGLQSKITLVNSDILSNIEGDFELIVSNPPYISSSYKVQKELEYEPKEALFGGVGGDEFIKKMLLEIKGRCRFFICEIGYDQREPLLEFIDTNSLGEVEFFKDYAGIDRFFVLEFDI
ncbi:MAG: peptide chain release factor N(5)-glutamine methyltransferase [Campylobacterales bacterium]